MALTLDGTTGITTSGSSSSGGSGVSTNTALGGDALKVNEAGGTNNTAVGYQALDANTTGDNNVAMGRGALTSNTTASNNTAVGDSALATNTTGTNLVAVGTDALIFNTTGSNNTALGTSALVQNTTASNNTAVGYQALTANTTATGNTAVGYQAGDSITTGEYNTVLGFGAGRDLTTGTLNTFVGVGFTSPSGSLVTTGSKNTILGGYNGNQGGLDIRTASNYIVLSDGDGNPRLISDGSGNWIAGATTVTDGARLTVNSSIAITNGTYFRRAYQSSDQNLYFSNGTNQAYLSSAGSWTNASDARLKTNIRDIEHGLNTVLATQPRHYERIDVNGTYIGFVAQELQTVIPEVVSGDPDTQLGVDYGALVAVAFKSIQELSAQVTALQAEVNALKGQ